MWQKAYRDYPEDTPLVKYQVETGRDMIGCEMHEINGWGNTLHCPQHRDHKRIRAHTPLDPNQRSHSRE
jgi:hypothetical protein